MDFTLEKVLTVLFTFLFLLSAAVTAWVGLGASASGTLVYVTWLLSVLAGLSGFAWWRRRRAERQEKAEAERLYAGMERDIADIRSVLDQHRDR